MTLLKPNDFTGYSDSGIDKAIQDALQKAGDYVRIEIVETRGSYARGDNREYHATVTTFAE